jgi:arylsulfatase
LIIVADDLAYSDLGVYGGEIETPNLDALARAGVQFTRFRTAPTCSPTRAMLLSGVDNHVAGIGNMAEELAPNQMGQPGYEGHLNTRVAALSELLRDVGYHTYLSGKWHLGLTEETSPAARGFERSFALLQGGGGHFDDLGLSAQGPKALYREDGKPATLPAGFYSTRFYADRILDYLKSAEGDGKPFFAYLAFSAPHWPLQAPEASIAKYRGRYDAGYDAAHAARLARMKELGLVAADAEVYPRHAGEPAWEDLDAEQKRIAAKSMEIYAAMVDDLDREVGRVVDYLKASGRFDDTIIFFLSDNGAEGHLLTKAWPGLSEWVAQCCDNRYENMGRANSYLWYGPNWGWAGAAPFRMFKGFTYEGGITVPAFVTWPARYAGARVSTAFASVLDVVPTVLELAGVAHPGTRYQGRPIAALQGRSLVPLLGGADAVHPADHVMGWELFGKRALRKGDWKIVWAPPPEGKGTWELFDTAADPSELHDRAATEPQRLAELIALWDGYARDNGVILPDRTSGY